MGTIEQVLKEWDLIIRDMDDLNPNAPVNDPGWINVLNRIDQNRKAIKLYMEMPNVVRNLQDNPQPER